jgi:anti-sigma factor RsiW
MNTARSRRLFHRPLKLLPWYVNSTLDPAEARKVAAHVSECLTCQREIGDLVKLFSGRARSLPKRPVDEARLDDLFARIDRYEAQPQSPSRVERVSLRQLLSTGIFGWLGARPALVAGAFAAVILAVIAVPTLLQSPVADRSAVRSSLNQHKLTNAYRLEPRENGEYVVIFTKQPSVEALSRLLEDWRGAPNVVDVAIDAE